MELSLAVIQESSSFVPAKPEACDVEWKNTSGETVNATVYVRHSSYATSTALQQAFRQGCDDIIAAHIVTSIVSKEGQPFLTLAAVSGDSTHGPMCQPLVDALMGAIAKVNRWGNDADPKPSTQKTNSGSNSSSLASADEPSVKQSNE